MIPCTTVRLYEVYSSSTTRRSGTVPLRTGDAMHVYKIIRSCFLRLGRVFSVLCCRKMSYCLSCKNTVNMNACRASIQPISHEPGNVIPNAVHAAGRPVRNRSKHTSTNNLGEVFRPCGLVRHTVICLLRGLANRRNERVLKDGAITEPHPSGKGHVVGEYNGRYRRIIRRRVVCLQHLAAKPAATISA